MVPLPSMPDSIPWRCSPVCASRAYDPVPCYPCVGGDTLSGWPALCSQLPPGGHVLAVDGPQILEWDVLAGAIAGQLRQRGTSVMVLDMRDHMASWDLLVKRTAPVELLADDPDFATIPRCALADLFDEPPAPPRDPAGLTLVVGPGAALVAHDELWYADLPKRYAE